MAIRQLPFDKGEELGVRSKGAKFSTEETDKILENIKQYLERKDVLIVKCGRSYYDVTAYPEIFDEGDEFRVEDLTSIDRKQMEKAEPPKPAFEDVAPAQPAVNPLAELYHRTDDEQLEDLTEALERKTYYLRLVDIEALTLLCHETREEVSAAVREIFKRGMMSISDEVGHDFYAEARENLTKTGFTGKKKTFKKK